MGSQLICGPVVCVSHLMCFYSHISTPSFLVSPLHLVCVRDDIDKYQETFMGRRKLNDINDYPTRYDQRCVSQKTV